MADKNLAEYFCITGVPMLHDCAEWHNCPMKTQYSKCGERKSELNMNIQHFKLENIVFDNDL